MTKDEREEILCYIAQEIISPLAFDERPAKEVWLELSGKKFNELCEFVSRFAKEEDKKTKENFVVHRGEVYYADLSPVIGSEQGGVRPVLIIQNDIGNKHSPTTIIAPITSRFTKKPLPTHLLLSNCGLAKDSIALCEQLRTIDKRRLKEKLGSMDEKDKVALDRAIEISLGLV